MPYSCTLKVYPEFIIIPALSTEVCGKPIGHTFLISGKKNPRNSKGKAVVTGGVAT